MLECQREEGAGWEDRKRERSQSSQKNWLMLSKVLF